jgi:hypothetical protein
VRVAGLLVLVFLMARATEAQSRIVLVGGTVDSCREQVQRVRLALESFPLPKKWTFVVACSATVWDSLLRRSDGLGKTHTAFTNLQAHYTYFNGATFTSRVAAHELGHILGKTDDEERAESLGERLMQLGPPLSRRLR